MDFNKNEFKRFREAIKKSVEGVEKDFGVEIEFGNISYTEDSFTVKTTVSNGNIEERRKNEFMKHYSLLSLPADSFGKEFIYKGLKTKIIGLELNRRKYPILVENEKGETFLMTSSGALNCLEKVSK